MSVERGSRPLPHRQNRDEGVTLLKEFQTELSAGMLMSAGEAGKVRSARQRRPVSHRVARIRNFFRVQKAQPEVHRHTDMKSRSGFDVGEPFSDQFKNSVLVSRFEVHRLPGHALHQLFRATRVKQCAPEPKVSGDRWADLRGAAHGSNRRTGRGEAITVAQPDAEIGDLAA